jgi:hypothetical protein
MGNPWGKVILAGIAGIVAGMLAEPLINELAGRIVLTDGMLWGAVLGIFIASIPNFTRMGSLTVKSDKPAVQFLAGVGMFMLISLIIIVLFFGLFSILSRFLP